MCLVFLMVPSWINSQVACYGGRRGQQASCLLVAKQAVEFPQVQANYYIITTRSTLSKLS